MLDPLENLDIYKDFLGEEEFLNMRQSYLKTIETMDLVYQTEIERIKLPDGLYEDVQIRNLTTHIEKFEYIFELTSGKGRESYMHRAHLEFP
jgi:hypothetical protein